MTELEKIRTKNNITLEKLAEVSTLDAEWIKAVEGGEVNIENITLKNAALLFKGLHELKAEYPQMDDMRDWDIMRSAYTLVKGFIG